MKKMLKICLRTTYLLVIAGMVIFFFYSQRVRIAEIMRQAKYLPMLLSGVVLLLSYMINCLIYRNIQLSCCGDNRPRVSFYVWLYIYFYSFVGRYIPGKFSILLGRFFVLEQYHVPFAKVTMATVCEQLIGIMCPFIYGVPALLFLNSGNDLLRHYQNIGIVLWMAVVFLFIFSFLTPFPYRLLNMIYCKLKQQPLIFEQLPQRLIVEIFGWRLIVFFLTGLSFLLFMAALEPVVFSVANIIRLASIYSLGGVIGILALFSPAGLGIREGVIVFLLISTMPDISLDKAVLVALGLRVVATLVELAALGVTLILKQYACFKESE